MAKVSAYKDCACLCGYESKNALGCLSGISPYFAVPSGKLLHVKKKLDFNEKSVRI